MSWSNGPSDQGGAYGQRPPRKRFFESMRASGWYRAHPRVIGGVCSGIAARSGWDLSLVRVLTVIAALCLPFVTLAYGLAWLLLPEAQDGRIHAEETAEGRFDIAFLGGLLLCLVSVSSVLPSVGVLGGIGIGLGAGWLGFLVVSAFVVGLIAFVISNANKSGQNQGTGSAPQYGTPSTPGGAGTTAPFGHSAPGAKDTGATMPQQQNTQAPEGFPAYGVPAGSAGSAGTPRPTGATTSATQGTNAGPRPAAARSTQPHPGWTPPPTAPRPRQWTPRPMPTHRPRTVSSRVNLAITGLLVLITAAVFAGLYWADKGLSIPFITGETEGQTIARIITVGGGVCLLIVGFSLAIAALRDRSAGWLTALSVIGVVLALPTALVGSQASHPTVFLVNTHVGAIGNQTTLDWTVDKVSGGNPASSTTLDLTGAPVGTTKTITVDWRAWNRLTVQLAEGQPVQIICQSSIGNLSTNMDGNGWAEPLDNCSGVTASSPAWGKPSLGGITILITDDADLETLTIVQSPDASGTWGSTPAAPSATPSATPSAAPSATPTPSPTPTDSQSGN